jgi:translocator protein
MENKSLIIRWITLIVILLNIAFNWLYTSISTGPNIQEVSRSFEDLFTPAGYVFSIWGLIYISFVVYGVVQLLPANRKIAVYDRLSIPLMVANILGSSWIVAFTNELIVISLIILVVTLGISILMFVRSSGPVSQMSSSRWLWVPFSLFFGWISVATIADAAVTLKYLGWNGGSFGPEKWAMIMIGIAGVLAILVDTKFNNYLYPLVIVWASIGIWSERQLDHPNIGIMALISSILVLLFVMVHALVRYFRTLDQ